MAAVLAVVLLVLCSSVRSSADGVQATITQVKVSDSPTTLPAITSTTEGSSDSHSAVLSNQVLREDDAGPSVLVDLARSDQEKLTTLSATPPTSDSVPSGFDMTEDDDSFTESFAESTTRPRDTGTLVEGYPQIGSSEDNTHRSGYGVVMYDASARTEDDLSLAEAQDHGTLVENFPEIGSSNDNSQGAGYGVQTYDAPSATIGDGSSITASEDLSLAETQPDEGTLLPGYPRLSSSEVDSQDSGLGVQTYDESEPVADSLSAYQPEDEYPLEHEDTTGGPGSGFVRPYGPFYGPP